MSYADEQILKLREEEKKKQFNTLETGIYIGGDILCFERRAILNTLSLSLPYTMTVMPIEFARIKYPSEFRPQVILTTPELDVNLGFTLLTDVFGGIDLEELADRMMNMIKRVYPDYRIYPGKRLKHLEGYFFSFRSHALDSDLYNMTLVMKIKDRLLQGSFNCLYKQHTEWRKIVLMMWETIQEWEEEEECVL